MKSRLTAWLSALLLFSAVFGAPVARVYTNRVSCCYVYSEQREHRREQLAETVERPRPPAPAFISPAPLEPVSGAILGFSLFQRPPPVLS
jgi:hypothetical protein